VKRERVIISDKCTPDPEIVSHVNSYTDDLNKKLAHVIGHVDVDLDAQFKHIRTSETNTGNFLADIVLLSNEQIDIAMIATGNMRANSIIKSGYFDLRVLS